jgi:hypothetical protein
MTCEEGWVHDLQNKAFSGWREEDCPTMAAMLAAKDRIREATRAYLEGLTEEQLNTTLAERPVDWGGELRSPAFICKEQTASRRSVENREVCDLQYAVAALFF